MHHHGCTVVFTGQGMPIDAFSALASIGPELTGHHEPVCYASPEIVDEATRRFGRVITIIAPPGMDLAAFQKEFDK